MPFSKYGFLVVLVLIATMIIPASVVATDIGVFYFPGWQSKSEYWNDLRGLPGSRSPSKGWPDRVPLLGYYAEENISIAEQHISWANQYGINFFVYDWYWNGKSTYLNHAIDNYLKTSGNTTLKFSILWANHSDVPKNINEFDSMVTFWLERYLCDSRFYRINNMPVVFVFSVSHLEKAALHFNWDVKSLFRRANKAAQNRGLDGIYFVSTTNRMPSDELEIELLNNGLSAYTAWNYVRTIDNKQISSYQSMVDSYLKMYDAATLTKGRLSYLVPASPGWDARPWHGDNATLRTDSTPDKFKQMLVGAKQLLKQNHDGKEDIVLIEAWNEFGEGAYIEPTNKWGMQYLDEIRNVFRENN